jgi:hypothetical protein
MTLLFECFVPSMVMMASGGKVLSERDAIFPN